MDKTFTSRHEDKEPSRRRQPQGQMMNKYKRSEGGLNLRKWVYHALLCCVRAASPVAGS